MFLELPGRVAIVTGGAQSIGFVIAARLAQAGARVILADREADRAEESAARLRADGYDAIAQKVDVAEAEQVQEMVKRLLKLPGLPGTDSADALACAICHAHGATMGTISTKGYRVKGGRLVK